VNQRSVKSPPLLRVGYTLHGASDSLTLVVDYAMVGTHPTMKRFEVDFVTAVSLVGKSF